jgi:hypothetical protein
VTGTVSTVSAQQPADSTPGSVDGIEKAIAERRAHLAATIDELADRATPKALVAKARADVQARVMAAVYTPDGELRTERLAAVGGAVAVLGSLMVLVRRRRRRH